MMESVGARIGGKLGFEIWKKGEGWNQAKAVINSKERAILKLLIDTWYDSNESSVL